MTTLETLRPSTTEAAGSWLAVGAAALHSATDEVTSNGDTDYGSLQRNGSVDGAGTTQSTMELGLPNPAEWEPNALQVRDAEAWDMPNALQVRDAESWKAPKSVRVRSGEAWVTVLPEVVVSVVARRELLGSGSVSGTVEAKVGTTVLASVSLSIGDAYGTTTLTVPLDAMLGEDPDDLRVAIVGSVTVDDALAIAELRVTQIEVDLND